MPNTRRLVWFFVFILTSSFCQIAYAQEQTPLAVTRVIVPPIERSSEKTGSYFPRLLELALEKTVSTHGPYQLISYPHQLTNSRFLAELERSGVINLMWAMTDKTREEKLIPIKISLLKELNSYRIFLIRKDDQARFNKIRTLDDLRTLRAGQGTSWPDTEILRKNRMPLVTSAHYELLFDMLKARRYDYFPRGLYEIWGEYSLHQKHNLAIEKNLMIHYHAPIYFFTNKENGLLAARIEAGLNMAIADGSFDELFYSYKGFKTGEEEINKQTRTLFELTTSF